MMPFKPSITVLVKKGKLILKLSVSLDILLILKNKK